MAKNVPKIANIGIFCHFRPLRSIKTLQKHFYLVEEVLSFDLDGSYVRNLLRIGFRNEYFTCTSQNEVDLDDLHIFKIGLKRGLGIGSHKISCKHFQQDFPQYFPQDFSTRISHKILPQDGSHKIGYSKPFHHKNFLQEFLQDFPQNFTARFLTEFPAAFP